MIIEKMALHIHQKVHKQLVAVPATKTTIQQVIRIAQPFIDTHCKI